MNIKSIHFTIYQITTWILAILLLIVASIPTSVSAQASSYTDPKLWTLVRDEYYKARDAQRQHQWRKAYYGWQQTLTYVQMYKSRNPARLRNDTNHARDVNIAYETASHQIALLEIFCKQIGIPCPNNGSEPPLVNVNPSAIHDWGEYIDSKSCGGGIIYEEAELVDGECGGIVHDEVPWEIIESYEGISDIPSSTQGCLGIEENITVYTPEYNPDVIYPVDNSMALNFYSTISPSFIPCAVDGTIEFNIEHP